MSGGGAVALHLDLGGEDLAAGRRGDARLHDRDVLRVGGKRRRVPQFHPHRFLRGRVAPQLAPAVDRDHRAVGLEQHHHLERRLEHRAEPRLAQGQLLRPLLDLAAKLDLGLLGERDVARHPDEADELAVGPEARLRHASQPAVLAVAAPEAALQGEGLEARLAGDALGEDALGVVGVDALPPVVEPRELAVAGAEIVHVGVVDEVAGAVEPRHPHQRRRRIGDPPEALLALAQRLLGQAVLGDVGDDDHHPVDLPALRVDPRHVIGLHRERPARRMVEQRGEELALALQRRREHRRARRIGLLADHLAHRPAEHLAARHLEPFGERLVDEAVALLAVEEGGHHRQQVGQRQDPGRREHGAGKVVRQRRAGRRPSGRGPRLPCPALPLPLRHALRIARFSGKSRLPSHRRRPRIRRAARRRARAAPRPGPAVPVHRRGTGRSAPSPGRWRGPAPAGSRDSGRRRARSPGSGAGSGPSR